MAGRGGESGRARSNGWSGPHAGGWSGELDGVLRGLTGGFLIGIPLIFTMEMWALGETITPARALLFLVCAYGLNFGFVTFAGFHREEPGSLRPAGDALEATALAITAAAVCLWLLHQVEPGTPLGVVVGRIAVVTLPISLGVSIANHLLGRRETRTGAGAGERDEPDAPGGRRAIALDLGAAFGGALFLCISIAPTEEIPTLAAEIPVGFLPLVVFFSLVVSYGIVFAAGFGGEERRLRSTGPFQRPLTETVAAYLIALVTAAALLALFGRIGAGTDWAEGYAQVVILGLPAAIGGAAGRLAV